MLSFWFYYNEDRERKQKLSFWYLKSRFFVVHSHCLYQERNTIEEEQKYTCIWAWSKFLDKKVELNDKSPCTPDTYNLSVIKKRGGKYTNVITNNAWYLMCNHINHNNMCLSNKRILVILLPIMSWKVEISRHLIFDTRVSVRRIP